MSMSEFNNEQQAPQFPETPEDVLLASRRRTKEMVMEVKTAGFWMRLWAYLIDLLVIGAITSIVVKPVFYLLDVTREEYIWYAPYTIASAIVFYGYFVLMTKLVGQTVGKMIFGLRVIADNGKPLTWGAVLFREWIGRFISVKTVVFYLLVAVVPNNKGLHDLIADTVVVHEDTFLRKEREEPPVWKNETVETV
ncbi:MAG: RDD family protein [Caryophanon sp.]|nr:RDD family protein [Caryophanon sp.]